MSAALFVIALLLFIKTQHYILIADNREIEAIIHKMRVRLMDQVRHSELLPLDAIGRAEIVAAITKETTTLMQATNMLAFAGQGVVLVFFVAIYVAYLSFLAFVLSVAILVVVGTIFHAKGRQLAVATRESTDWDNRLFDRLMDLLDGFKEIRLNRSRSDDLFDDAAEVSRAAANIKIRTQSDSFKQLVFCAELYVSVACRRRVRGPHLQRDEGGLHHASDHGSVFIVGVCRVSCNPYRSCRLRMPPPTTSSAWRRDCRRLPPTAPDIALAPRQRFDKIEMREVMFITLTNRRKPFSR